MRVSLELGKSKSFVLFRRNEWNANGVARARKIAVFLALFGAITVCPVVLGARPGATLETPAGRGGFLLPHGWFTTRGAQIVDERGMPVRLASVGLPGCDGIDNALRLLRFVNYQVTMRGLVADGFNTVRIAWSDLTLNASPKAGAINFDLNPDLKGLSSMQVMDKIVDYAGTIGLRIIFDHHTNDGGDQDRKSVV